MKSTISKEVREEAAMICAIAAGGGLAAEWDDETGRVYSDIHKELEVSADARDLAVGAYMAIRYCGITWTRELDGEAEALLRCGWCPGDPVVRL